jgi:uncharacterized protein YdaU (DUF1376 family)
MKDKLPYMPFFGRDFYDDDTVACMTYEEQGMYLRLLWHQWVNGSIPGEAEQVARILGVVTVPQTVLRCFPPNGDGRRKNDRLHVERQRASAAHEAMRRGGSRGGKRRKEAHLQARLKPGSSLALNLAQAGPIARPQARLKQPEPEPYPEQDIQQGPASSQVTTLPVLPGGGVSARAEARAAATPADHRLTPEGNAALARLCRSAQHPDALLAEVRMILDGGRPGVPSDPAAVSLALHDMLLAGGRVTGAGLRAFVARAARGECSDRSDRVDWDALIAKAAAEDAQAAAQARLEGQP